MKNYDVAVIGGGVIGGFCTRELSRYDLKVVALEKTDDVAFGASRANSGIVHGGFDAKEGTLKAKFNVLGNVMMEKVCSELGVKYVNNGSLVLASGEEQEKTLYELLARGEKNGVKDLSVIKREELLKIEPNIADDITAALYAKTGGIVCPFNLTIAAFGNAMDNGADLICNFEVVKAEKVDEGYDLISEKGDKVHVKYVINCAGFNSDKIAGLFGDKSFKIGARKGEYILLDNTAKGIVNHTVFTVPTKAGKGVLVSRTVDDNILVGPTSIEEENYDTSIRVEGFDEIKEKANLMIKNIPYGATITSFAGVRAYCDRHDFIIEESAVCDKLFNVAGIESPGLTSAPAIGEFVAEFVAKKFGAKKKADFNPIRRSSEFFKALSNEEKNKLIKEKPEYGKIVCRCETVTLGEVLDALRDNPKAHTIDGVKLRTRAGMGRCQGGFCSPTVFNLLMEEYGYKAEEVTKNGGKSFVIIGGEI